MAGALDPDVCSGVHGIAADTSSGDDCAAATPLLVIVTANSRGDGHSCRNRTDLPHLFSPRVVHAVPPRRRRRSAPSWRALEIALDLLAQFVPAHRPTRCERCFVADLADRTDTVAEMCAQVLCHGRWPGRVEATTTTTEPRASSPRVD